MHQYCETILNGTPKYTSRNGAGLNFFNLEKSLIICADDFALNDSVSDAVVQLARAGRISATSVLSLSPLWPTHALKLKEQRGLVDVGLHLDLTSEFARTAGYGASLGRVMLRSFGHGYHSTQLDSVIESQLDKFESIWGGPPEHIDGHQHIHQFPGIRSCLLRVLCARYSSLNERPWVRVSQVRPAHFKSNVISLTGAQRLKEMLVAEGFNLSPLLLGVYRFNLTQEQYRVAFNEWLHWVQQMQARDQDLSAHNLPPTIMCHPGVQAQVGDAIGWARSVEFDYLSSEAFRNDLSAASLRLVRGSECIRKNK